MSVKAVAFDLDGTLFDHAGASSRAVAALVRRLGGIPTPQHELAWVEAEVRHFEAWRAGTISFREQRRRRLREFLPRLTGETRGWSDTHLDSTFDTYLRAYEAAWSTFPEVPAVLGAIRATGLSLGLLTNGNSEQQLGKLRATGIAEQFDAICTSESLGVAKPHRDAFLALCARLKARPEEVLFVGDDYEKDVVGARNAGLRAVFLDRDGSGGNDEPGHRNLRALLPLLSADS